MKLLLLFILSIGMSSYAEERIQLAAGKSHSCAIKNNKVYCWGSNEFKQLDVPSDIKNPKKIAAGRDYTCVIDEDGVKCWGYDYGKDEVPKDFINPSDISVGLEHACVIDKDGVKCWGSNLLASSTPPYFMQNPRSLSSDHLRRNCVVADYGNYCWGGAHATIGLDKILKNLRNVEKIVNHHGSTTTCVLFSNSIARCFLGDGTVTNWPRIFIPLENVMDIAAGHGAICSLGESGLKCFDRSGQSAPKVSSDAYGLVLGGVHGLIVDNGAIVCWRRDSTKPCNMPDFK